ncbi:hypothetical protein M0R45_023849 [Rubus argutus]|uniref:DUF3444 domain-containing protein n=1 Tax=Rubus argutus TaxID=59490 RepID=A0AAW1WPT4_RUBAR
MECNKEEALKAKEIAELKVAEFDFAGAKRFALKAQNLYPELDGLPQFLATLNVYTSAVKEQMGKLIATRSSVWILWLMKTQSKSNSGNWLLFFNQIKINLVPDGKSSMPASQNGFHNFSNYNHSNTRDQMNATHTKPFSTSHPPKGRKPTFWTICSSCKVYFEYLRMFLNHKLLCHQCRKHFIAYQIPAPRSASTSWTSDIEQLKSSQHTMPNNSYAQEGHMLPLQIQVYSSSQPVLKVVKHQLPVLVKLQVALRQHSGQLKRGHEEVFPDKEARQWKFHAFKNLDDVLPTGSPNAGFSSVPSGVKPKRKRHRWQEMQTQVGMGNGGVAMNNVFGSPKLSFGTGRLDAAARHRVNCTRELSHLELRNVLMEKGKIAIFKKLDKLSIPSVSKTADTKVVKEKGQKEACVQGVKSDMTGCRVFVDAEDIPSKKSSSANSHGDSDVEEDNTVSMTVPDPDFHDFDKDRTESHLVATSWLNSKSNHELGPLDWVACGFPKTSGDLRIGKHGVYKYLHSFSHKVKWTKGTRGAVRIYPAKGDVWALYRNWSPDWDEHTPDEVIHKYDMVEVLEDYNEERGVSIVPLAKVAGFKTVFRQHSDRSTMRTIPREEMFRFSHQVPYYLLTGLEGKNAPKGCLELDPASTPLELLQVKSEAQAKMEEIAEKCNGEVNGKVL